MNILTIIAIITLITACYFIILSLVTNTENIRSALIFKIIPFFLSLGCLFSSLKLFGLI